ncbi:MAG: tetratricopeptide repeat protein [Acidobacteria bacterium]|nr:tetratricopeptide repeat protein [Acidobacteriota bacterium]
MAKQRRAAARPTKKKPAPATPASSVGGTPQFKQAAVAAPPPLKKRSTFPDAVQAYERGLQALQQHRFADAVAAFQTVLDRYPEEKELHERARLYLNVCLRQLQPPDPTPKNADERVYAATLAINDNRYDDGVAQLEAVLREFPDHDYASYMLGVAEALRGNAAGAISHLRRSFELNSENLVQARRDPDLERLRQDDGFRQLLESLAPIRRERRPGGRSRGAR